MTVRDKLKLYPLIIAFLAGPVIAEPIPKSRIAVLEFELKDTTLAPRNTGRNSPNSQY